MIFFCLLTGISWLHTITYKLLFGAISTVLNIYLYFVTRSLTDTLYLQNSVRRNHHIQSLVERQFRLLYFVTWSLTYALYLQNSVQCNHHIQFLVERQLLLQTIAYKTLIGATTTCKVLPGAISFILNTFILHV